jgi:hypothetical protein
VEGKPRDYRCFAGKRRQQRRIAATVIVITTLRVISFLTLAMPVLTPLLITPTETSTSFMGSARILRARFGILPKCSEEESKQGCFDEHAGGVRSR